MILKMVSPVRMSVNKGDTSRFEGFATAVPAGVPSLACIFAGWWVVAFLKLSVGSVLATAVTCTAVRVGS